MNKKSDAISVNFSLFVNYLYKLGIVGIDSKDMIGKVEKNIMQNVL